MAMMMMSSKVSLTQSRNQPDTEAGKEPTREKQGDSGRNSLQHNAQVEDPGGDHQRRAAAKEVGEEGGGEGAEEGAAGQDGDDGGFLGGGDVEIAVGVAVACAEEVFPVGHGHDATDGAGVISARGDGRG